MTHDEAMEMLVAATAHLMEHFSAVQILGTWESSEGNGMTNDVGYGKGNWYSRVGLCSKFMDIEKARNATSSKQLDDDEDETPKDNWELHIQGDESALDEAWAYYQKREVV